MSAPAPMSPGKIFTSGKKKLKYTGVDVLYVMCLQLPAGSCLLGANRLQMLLSHGHGKVQ